MTSPSPIRESFIARVWFPLTLLGWLLLGMPGLALFILNLLGKQKLANDWLEKTFHFSYHMPVPGWAGLILVLIPLALLLLYFLKLKRKPLSVPSTFLWRKSIEDLHVNSLFQWLRENVLLLLQLLALLALIYSIMGFHLHGHSGEGAHYILLIDNSASMSATDVAPTRLDGAKQDALKEIDAHTDNDFGMVMEFNSSAEIKQAYTGNRDLLRQAVRNIRQTERPTRIEEALSLADSLANPIRSAEDSASRPANEQPGKERTYETPKGIPTDLHLFSDGRFPDLSESGLSNLNSRALGNQSALGNLNLHFHLAGKPGPGNVNNLGLVSFDALRDESDPTTLQVFFRVFNFGAAEATARVELERSVNGLLEGIPEKIVQVPARKAVESETQAKDETAAQDSPGETTVSFELHDVDERTNLLLHARLANARDQFSLDDQAWLVAGVTRKARVLIVGPPNEVLEKFFFDNEALQGVATIKHEAPDYLDKEAYQQAARNGSFDLVLFDRCSPKDEKSMPRANTFFIGRPPPPWKMEDTDRLENPHIKGWAHDNPILRYLVALHDVLVSEAFTIKDLPPHTPRLIETDRNGTVMFTLTRGPFTDLVMTFSLIDDNDKYVTNWPLRPSFPIFLQNVLYTLGNVRDAATEETVQPGQVKALRPDTPMDKVTVISPDGTEHQLTRQPGDLRTDFAFGETDLVGEYRVLWPDGGRRSFAVNLLDPEESNIEPRATIQVGTERFAAGAETNQPREIWRWFALAALGVVLLEWYIYNRRIYI